MKPGDRVQTTLGPGVLSERSDLSWSCVKNKTRWIVVLDSIPDGYDTRELYFFEYEIKKEKQDA